ncbi:TetR/AcrR family transcriptional regulator [Paenibacillus lutrae]|uniref:TetR family transcriptional regulator n=1 Tax=Paenibacillus lutrae TaxID=2078573 RepID=A0A7X3JXG6_9BACL|nr:TetR/AcrR family transcriptional regulator [Paenibacillus lutrae]MVO98056.1 TetR family transcriptional regulator [Paenibacillus lutrae]
MPRNPEKDQQLREQRKQQILQSALQVFFRKGYSGAKVSEIASEAGISHANLYNFYKSKDDMYEALLDYVQDFYGQLTIEASRQLGSAKEKLLWHCRHLLNSSVKVEYIYLIVQTPSSDSIPENIRSKAAAKARENLEPLIRIMQESHREGKAVSDQPEMMALCYLSLIQGLAVCRFRGFGELSQPLPEEVVRFFIAD